MGLIEKLDKGELKLYSIDSYVDSCDEAVKIRREFIEKKTNTQLEHISNYSINMDEAFKKNIENPIGVVQIPLGVIGPLKCNGNEYYVPLATSEGALLASANRGASAITSSGGCNSIVLDDKMTRAPVIRTNSIKEAYELKNWIINNFPKLKEIAESTTSHGKLVKIDPILISGLYVYPRFTYTTGDSMGMNMVTIATEKILKYLEEQTNAIVIASSGNACTDKKPSQINNILGRGKSVSAEVLIPEEILKTKLKTDAETFVKVNTSKNLLGSNISGSMAYNAHFANLIAGVFLATGQDMAHVAEGALGTSYAEERNKDLYFNITLPDLPIATIGGGTRLETAQENLKILGLKGENDAKEFASIIASTVLAGELSLISALSAGHLARAHQKLGR